MQANTIQIQANARKDRRIQADTSKYKRIQQIQANITNATDAPTPILFGPPAENE